MVTLYRYSILSFALSAIFFIAACQCDAERIYCKDGQVLNEKITYRNRGIVWYKRPAGSVGININDIEKIENDDGSVSKYDYKTMGRKIQECIRQGSYGEAVGLCSMLLETIPDNARLRYLRGILSQKVGNFEKAEEDYAFLVKNNMADAAILNNLGTIYAADKKYREAADLFLKAAAENPEMVEVHDNLAMASLQAGDYSRATAEYEKVIAREPGNINALYNLGIIYMSKNNFEKAKMLWEKALSIKPEDEDTKNALQYLEDKRGSI